MKKLFRYFLGRFTKLFLIYPLFLMQTDQQPVDNLTILNNLASTVVHGIVDRLSPDSSASFLIRSQNQQQLDNWLIENWFVRDLQQRGISKIFINQQDSVSKFIIEFQILTLGVQYLPTTKKKLIERQCKINLAIRAQEGSSGLIKFIDQVNEQYTDSVKIHEINNLEKKHISFTQASLPEMRGFRKYIEPFIIMTTTAGIVYLFFRLRSN